MRDGGPDTGDGVRFVVFDADEDRLRRNDLRQNLGALNEFFCLTLHQCVIGGDVGFTFGAVDQQRLNRSRRPRTQFYSGGKAGAAHARNAGSPHPLHQCGRIKTPPVGDAGEREPVIRSIGLDHNTLVLKPGCVGNGSRFNRRHSARRRSMHRHTHHALRLGDRLPTQHTVPDIHDRLRRHAKVLAQRQH